MSDDVEPSIKPAWMYDKLSSLDLRLAEISVTLQSIPPRLADHETRLRELESATDVQHRLAEGERRLTDHETRVRGIERRIWTAVGVTIVVSMLLSAGIAALAKNLIGV